MVFVLAKTKAPELRASPIPRSQEPHPVLKLGLAKANNSRGRWEEAHFALKNMEVFVGRLADMLIWGVFSIFSFTVEDWLKM